MTRLIAMFFALALVVPAQEAFAYSSYGSGASAAGLSNSVTRRVVRRLSNDFRSCNTLNWAYRYDCYRISYDIAATQLAGLPAYAPAAKALAGVETAIGRIVDRNVDRTKPRLQRGQQVFRPITEASVPRAKAAIADALEEAETQLLRASANTGTHFSRIAAAVNSNKILLRSALRQIATWVQLA